MAKTHSIEPFPSDIDRDYFGAWLSGFTDGEGCFHLAYVESNHTPQIVFQLSLRADDFSILNLVRSYFQCGNLRGGYDRKRPEHKPSFTFRVAKMIHVRDVVVKHFDTFPLLAKKKRDFIIWKKAVELASEVAQRPIYYPGGQQRGRKRRWTEKELLYFKELLTSLKNVRKYQSDFPILPETPIVKTSYQNLF